MENQGAARYRITVFGELSVVWPEGEVSRFTTRRVAALLAYIALRPERVHTRDALTEALWPEEDPEKTRPRLRQTLALLKKDLAAGGIELEQLLLINRLELRLNTDQATTDFGELHSLLRATRIAETPARLHALSTRVRELAAEELLPNFYDEWVLQARQSVQEALSSAPLPSDAQALPRQNPEPPTAFFGRDTDLDRLRQLLVPGALVTLTAMGGMGKTRLALELARQEPESVFVSLVDLTEHAQFAPALAKALGLASAALGSDPLATVVLKLRAYPSLLLILDNAEHLIEPVTQLVQHLRQELPRLRFLVTSRQRLGLSAEQELTLSPLPIHSDALALFVNRAQLALPGFSCTPQNEALLARLCTRLDGIPLALEMAAAWLAVLTPEQILTRLERRFSLLVSRQTDTPTRQQSLFQVIESSVALLPSPVRALLGNLTVFCGGWTVEAAEEICGDGLLEGLALLRERALIQSVRGQDLARFRMLETIREFSLGLPREATLGDRHARYYARQAEAERTHLSQTTETASLNRIEEDHENFTAALDYLTHHDLEAALQLACALDHFWILRGHLEEGRGRFSALLAQPGSTATARAWALRSVTLMSHYLGDHATAMEQAEAALALFEVSNDQRGIDWTQSVLATAALELGHYARAEQLLLATLEQPTLSPLARASLLMRLGLLNYARGDYARSAALCREGWGIAQTCQSPPECARSDAAAGNGAP